MNEISIIIVNYNTQHEVKRAINSVLRQRDIAFAIYVIDNASQDNSVEVLKAFGEQIHFIASEKNLGFGKANNLLFQQVSTPYIYLMNPDAWLEDEHTLVKLVNSMRQHADYGMVSTTIMNEDNTKEAPPNYRYPRQQHLQHSLPVLPGKVAWILGADMAMPSAVFRQLHGFDEEFFLYGEDIDICMRARKAGYTIGFLPEITIRHVGGASEKRSSIYDKQTKKCYGIYQFYQKHYYPEDIIRLMTYDSRRAKFLSWSYRLAFLLTRNPYYRERYFEKRAIFDSFSAKIAECQHE
ncbi:MAG: glycosyltransferase family 2 protein [Gammaproteobacteria bacterium]|nr:glycosyltransferase family 2 protein [Gammaproteobacteria bacterium]